MNDLLPSSIVVLAYVENEKEEKEEIEKIDKHNNMGTWKVMSSRTKARVQNGDCYCSENIEKSLLPFSNYPDSAQRFQLTPSSGVVSCVRIYFLGFHVNNVEKKYGVRQIYLFESEQVQSEIPRTILGNVARWLHRTHRMLGNNTSSRTETLHALEQLSISSGSLEVAMYYAKSMMIEDSDDSSSQEDEKKDDDDDDEITLTVIRDAQGKAGFNFNTASLLVTKVSSYGETLGVQSNRRILSVDGMNIKDSKQYLSAAKSKQKFQLTLGPKVRHSPTQSTTTGYSTSLHSFASRIEEQGCLAVTRSLQFQDKSDQSFENAHFDASLSSESITFESGEREVHSTSSSNSHAVLNISFSGSGVYDDFLSIDIPREQTQTQQP